MILYSSAASDTQEALQLATRHVSDTAGKLPGHVAEANEITQVNNSSQSLWTILFNRERTAIAFDVLIWLFIVLLIACIIVKCQLQKAKTRKLSRSNSIYRKESRNSRKISRAPPSATLELLANQV